MKREWLDLLCDPFDRSPLTFDGDVEEREGRVITATLRGASGRTYPVRESIPSFLTEAVQPQESVESFAYEWEQFGFLFARDGWIKDVVAPVVNDISFFAGKTVVDAGAGSGAQTRWMAEAGAKLVFSLELSSVIFTRHKASTREVADRVFPIQCDIRYPPVRGPVDVVYSVNVMQHTADPRETFRSLGSLVAPDGNFLFNIYTKRSDVKYAIVSTVRRVIRPLPFALWKALAWLITFVAWPLSRIPFLRRYLRVVVPISHSFRETWLDVYDAFGGHWYQQNMRVEDQHRMIEQNGFRILAESAFAYLLGRR